MAPFSPLHSPYLTQCIRNLARLDDQPELAAIDERLLRDVAFYVHKRLGDGIDSSAICGLLAEAMQRLQGRMQKQDEIVRSPARYLREIVKHLVQDKIRDEQPPERFIISSEGIGQLRLNGLPPAILDRFEALVDPQAMAYRTFLDKFNSIFKRADLSQNEIDRYRRLTLGAFRVQTKVFGADELLHSAQATAEDAPQSVQNDAYQQCLQTLRKMDRDLIKLRFGLDKGLDGHQFTFEELQMVFGFESLQKVRNRYHYILRQLRDCLTEKGYPRG